MKKLLSLLLCIALCFSTVITANSAENKVLGDVNLDHNVSVIDATLIQRHLSRQYILSEENLANADVSGDGNISIMDATLIQQFVAQIIPEFPAVQTRVYGVSATASSESSINVTWYPIVDATKYWIYVNGELYSSSTTNSAVVKCKLSKTYEIKVTAKLVNGTILKVEDAQPVYITMDKLPSAKVLNVSFTDVTNEAFTVSWDNNSDYSKYWIYLNDVLYTSTTDSSLTISELSPNTDYEVYVLAQLHEGTTLKKADADILCITTKTDPPEEPIKDFDDYANRISAAQNENTLTISLISDVHYDMNNSADSKKIDNLNKLGELQDKVNVDFVANLGDFVVGNEEKETTLASLNKLIQTTDDVSKAPVLNVRGNHDDNGWYSLEGHGGTSQKNEIINDEEWHDIAIASAGENFVTDINKPHGGYGYIDHESSKIRIFMINSCDIPYLLEDDGATYRYNSYKCYALSNEQLNFVANALKFSDKENPDEWAALFLTHVPLDTTNDNGYRFGTPDALIRGHAQLLSIISAYRKGTSYTYSGSTYNKSLGEKAEDFYVDIAVDYSSKGVGVVISFISGHTLADNMSQAVGYENSLSHGYTYLGLVGSESFETIVINRENSTLKAFKYGEIRPQNTITSSNPGAIDGQAELDIDMTPGVFTLHFDQFRPNGESLYNGASDIWTSHFYVSSATLDFETLELSTAEENKNWLISKAVPVKASTQYIFPAFGSSQVLYYNYLGKYSGTISTIKDFDADKKILTTKDVDGYLIFVFHKPTYPDYNNFYLKELSYGLEY
ncbi:MAG: dockerin type I domain-containing protein [Eubacteriales bacterium]|nr:dockerin type I domain-containing protein [Eubacteriales bacterium]